jgi:hypothetical protein
MGPLAEETAQAVRLCRRQILLLGGVIIFTTQGIASSQHFGWL